MVTGANIEWVARPYVAPSADALRHRLPAAIRAFAWFLSTLAVVAAAWWALAPPALGGATTLVIVDGTSMLPSLHRDELVALRRPRDYDVGDVVGYRSTLLHRIVLHRIIKVENGHYTFKGDNNSFLDPEHPPRGQLVGRLVVSVPRAGRLIAALHVPWILGAVACILVLLLGLHGSGSTAGEHADKG